MNGRSPSWPGCTSTAPLAALVCSLPRVTRPALRSARLGRRRTTGRPPGPGRASRRDRGRPRAARSRRSRRTSRGRCAACRRRRRRGRSRSRRSRRGRSPRARRSRPRSRYAARPTSRKMTSEQALPTEAIAERSTRLATTSTSAAVISSPACAPSREPRPKKGGNCPRLGEHRRQAARRVEGRVHRRRGREQGGDRHHREAGVSERRSRGLGDRGLAVADRLVDGERPEDAERDEDVERRS